MQWLKWAFISIGILIVICVGGLVLHSLAYSQGESAGYSNGYETGNTAGHETGYNLGHTDGYHQGKQEGYDEGYLSGKTDGYEIGVEIGYEEGVEAGLGHDYTIKDPTYKQVIKFLTEDRTDRNRYVEDTYVCNHFARDVCNKAEMEGIRCAYVGLVYREGGHAIIAFNTIDEGLAYFEPQSDERVEPVVGKRFYQCIEPGQGYYYEKPTFDDTIMEILVIW